MRSGSLEFRVEEKPKKWDKRLSNLHEAYFLLYFGLQISTVAIENYSFYQFYIDSVSL